MFTVGAALIKLLFVLKLIIAPNTKRVVSSVSDNVRRREMLNSEKDHVTLLNEWINQNIFVLAVSNPCKGTCSHLCLLRPGGYTCACPEGTNFIPGSNTECDAGKNWNFSSFSACVCYQSQRTSCVEVTLINL